MGNILAKGQYQSLDGNRIVDTVKGLLKRVCESFPDANLHVVCGDLVSLAKNVNSRSEHFGRRVYWLHGVAYIPTILCLLGVGVVAIVHRGDFRSVDLRQITRLDSMLPLLDAGTNVAIVVGALLLFLLTIETRWKRSKALAVIHEIRSIAHIIDMHHLTKDLGSVLAKMDSTSDPSHTTIKNPNDLNCYLDYCSEMLALTGKMAALCIQHFNDPVVLAAVTEIETMTTGLSNKIWQKKMVLYQASWEGDDSLH